MWGSGKKSAKTETAKNFSGESSPQSQKKIAWGAFAAKSRPS